MNRRLLAAFDLLALGFFFIATSALAVEVKSLPAFSVTRSDGALVSSTALSEVNQYVLLYLAPGCRSCDSLLAMLDDPESPQLAKRVVIIVRADASKAAKYIRERVPPGAGEVSWYADQNDEAFRALQFTGIPNLLGIRNHQVIWSVSGVLNDNSMVRPVIRNWTKN